MTYEYMLTISLYRVVQRVRVMTLHLGVVNGEVDMVNRSWGCFCDMSAMIRCPGDSGVGICAQLCVYAFRYVQIVVYDVGGYHMDVVINCGEVDCVCGCVMDFMMFLVYFWGNNHDIITLAPVSTESSKCDILCMPEIFTWWSPKMQGENPHYVLGAYMHHTLDTSLIYSNVYSIHSNFYQNIKTTQKLFS